LPLKARRTTAPPTHKDLESLATRDMMTFPHNMLDIIKEIIGQQSPCPKKPLFCFKMTTEAVEKNFMVLKSHQFSLEKAIEAQAGSPVKCGYEFRKPEILKPLLGNHCLWPRMNNILLHRSQWLLTPITESERVGDFKKHKNLEITKAQKCNQSCF
jgi:hypothetical protein